MSMMQHYQFGSALLDGRQRTILATAGQIYDLAALLGAAAPSALTLLQGWEEWEPRLGQLAAQAARGGAALNLAALTWLPPIQYPGKLACAGANYQTHNAEMGHNTRTKYPYFFFKPPTTTLVGDGACVELPGYAQQIDWEVELAVVIGRRVKHVRGEAAMAAIAGYSILNDISARDFLADQSFLGVDWVMLKGADGFAPMGPLITPAAFVPDPQALELALSVNGVPKQQASTADMAFSVRELIEHLTQFMTLEPGDVIATGTPPGVGFGRRPPEFLKPGDRMVAEIEGLGRLTTIMVAPQR
jgi:2-keto-4-pentenoate hydratase/2-oxohepta-3-ene-1,7-dioic acid hydratase in catechol pathway